ncbi:PilN domain-containing protein [Tepidimonas taiwanensis]|uniref:PilN domain-containing protein n=1 Tax=Tepidimonas taiwanensis TaxID=307486 RepID=UPI000733FB72|nr:PilN domain-containing protein [Tepidimonas taiwanensis]
MITINLLPHREWVRKRRREAFYRELAMSAALGLAVAALIYTALEMQLSNQADRNRLLQDEIAKLDAQIKEVATLRAEVEALKARQQAVQELQSARNGPVRLFNELVQRLPDGIALRSVKQEGSLLTITGIAQSQERVSELLRRLNSDESSLRQPQLIEIAAGNVTLAGGVGQRPVFQFSIRATQVNVDPGVAAGAGTTDAGPAAQKPPAGTT